MHNLANQHTNAFRASGFFVPDSKIRRKIGKESSADICLCWTCGSCDTECPVNIATGRLRPQKIVRLANLGFLDELLHMPEIWYCITCRRCSNICPNVVSPSTLIEYIRRKAIFSGIVSIRTLRLYQDLFTRFQRVRWHAIHYCFNKELTVFTEKMWLDWQERPGTNSAPLIIFQKNARISSGIMDLMTASGTRACFTCGECSSACPIVSGRDIFDPRALFRMINLGMIDELMQSPSIWLCIACGRCTESCSQLVDGRQIIDQIREIAIQKGALDSGFQQRVEQANEYIYKHFLNKIDLLLQQ